MFFYEGYICPVCKQKFKENDDIVACPECGAPHHRECWKQEGHCHFAADHGTPRQWKRPEESSYSAPDFTAAPGSSSVQGSSNAQHPEINGSVKYCTRCGQQNPEYAEFCSRCGQKLTTVDWSSRSDNQAPPPDNSPYSGQPPYGNSPYGGNKAPFGSYGEYSPFHIPVVDPYGGVQHDEKIQGVTAEELVTYVGSSSSYYIPRFFKMARSGSHTSWNWAALLFTPYWLLYRKNYISGSIVLFLLMLRDIIFFYILGKLPIDTNSATSFYQLFNALNALNSEGSYSSYLTILSLLSLATILVQILFGIIGNTLYMRTSLARIQKIQAKAGTNVSVRENMDYRQELASRGGVSLIMVAVGAGIVWFGELLFQALLSIKK